MLDFTVGCLLGGRQGTIVLISGDADFARTAAWCRQQGCVRLVLLHPAAPRCGAALLGLP
jgi:hypothetical protein